MSLDLFAPRQTYGYHCASCGELWDAYQVPCPIDVALRNMKSNGTCIKCGSSKILILMPYRYQELQRGRISFPATSGPSGLDMPDMG